MKAEIAHRHTAGTYHSHDTACLGGQIRQALCSARLTANSPLRVLSSMLDLPVGSRFIYAFRKMPLDKLSHSEAWLRIPFQIEGRRDYAITVPNFLLWHRIRRNALKVFLSSKDDELADAMRSLLSIPSSRLSWSGIATALESSIYGEGHSPVLVRYLNGLDAFAVSDASLDGSPFQNTRSEDEVRHPIARHDGGAYPLFQSVLRRMADCVIGNASGQKIWTLAIDQLDPMDGSDDAQLVRAGFWFNQFALSDGKAPGLERWFPLFAEAKPEMLKHIRPKALSSRLEYMRQIIPALKILRSGGGKSTQGATVCAARILQASGLFPEFGGVSIIVRGIGNCEARPVLWPNLEPFGMETVECTSLQSAARHALEIILIHGWQRFRALRSLCLSDIHCSGNIVEIRIPDDKGGRRDQVIPIYRLAPPEALEVLRKFREEGETLDIPLTELAGFGRVGKYGKNSRTVYKKMLRWAGNLHMPRKIGLSCAPLRAQVCRSPNLRNHPYFPEELRNHWWFSDEGLAQFRRLLPAQNTDVAEVIRRIAGWTTYTQLFSTYCRTWHIQLGLLLSTEDCAK